MSTWVLELPITPPSKKEAEYGWDGIDCTVKIGGEHVRIVGIEAKDRDGAHQLAMKAANRFLDRLAWDCNEGHRISSEGRSYKIINEGNGPKTGLARVDVSVVLADSARMHDRVIVEKRDENGNVISIHDSDKPGKLEGGHTDAMSFLRRGMLAEDVAEKLRNYCLAIENTASWICNRDGVRASEAKCMQHALEAVYEAEPALRNLQVVWDGKTPDVDRSLCERIYKRVRCQLAHAKDGQAKRMPFDEEDMRSMLEDRGVVERVAKDLIGYQLRVAE